MIGQMVIRYSQHERILLYPSLRDIGVRIERVSSLQSSRHTATLAVARSYSERLLDDLLLRYNALRVSIRFSSENSGQFPISGLDSVPSIAGSNGSSLTGSSGISVSAVFFKSSQNDIDSCFQLLLKELIANRILVAPVTSLKLKRLHRYIRRRTLLNATELSVMLPSDGGAAVSTEGMSAFLALADSGVWNLGDSESWSTLILSDNPTTNNYGQLHRTMWIDVSSSPACHERQITGRPTSELCRQSISLGMQYGKVISLDSAADSSSVNISLADVVPVSANSSSLRKPVFADSVSVGLVFENSSGVELQWNQACASGWDKQRGVAFCRLEQPLPVDAKLVTLRNASVAHVNNEPFWVVHTSVLRPAGVANRGSLISTLVNNHPVCAVVIAAEQIIPSSVTPLFQSLSVSASFINGTYKELFFNDLRSHLLSFMDDGSFLLSFEHNLPPESRLSLSIDYDPIFWSLDDFPGDLNRGIEVPPLISRFISGDQRCQELLPVELVSNALLILTPLPDMSMPFNVLSLSCTLYAFVVGSFVNLLVRKASSTVKYQLDPTARPASKLQQIKEKIKSIISKVQTRVTMNMAGSALDHVDRRPV